ncbi:inositol-pentakisphosphate 2-kinase [Xylariales sp. PMI_506]|nr:inositol-pentakisphosphate 2-kinase [Xylariales sp. PMI_506]
MGHYQAELEKWLRDNGKYTYVAEGRANAVFRIDYPAPSAVNDSLGNKYPLAGWLIRVSIQRRGAKPYDYERLNRYWSDVVEPAVGSQHLVPQLLIHIDSAQATLLNDERQRRSTKKEDGDISIAPGHAMLIQDMSPLPSRNQIGFEFKPKWLAQSPLAPADAVRCRTCAREAYRNSQLVKEGKDVKLPVCPLGLIHPDDGVLLGTIKLLTPSWCETDQARLKDAFNQTQILHKIRRIQVDGDHEDHMFTNPQDQSFGLSMTLRDCTVFVRMLREPSDTEVEIKLADVDEKNWESKQEYWQKSQKKLVDGGFYSGTEYPGIKTNCLLSLEN